MRSKVSAAVLGLALLLCSRIHAGAADTLTWNTNQDLVSADIRAVNLVRVLEGVSQLTGWRVYIESNTSFMVSVRFKDLPAGEALRHLLGDLNFALVPETNEPPRLFVFRSSRKNATQYLRPADLNSSSRAAPKIIPNELIVRLKPGASIDDLARAIGAKVIGRIDSLNAYRLQFSDTDAANAARQQLAGNSDVAGVESNYFMDAPPQAIKLDSAGAPPIQLKLNPPDSSGRVMVGLIDTAVQPLGNDLDKFLFKALSVAGPAGPDTGEPTHGTSMFENVLRAASAVGNGSSAMQVLSVDVYGPNPTTNPFDVAAGIVQAVNNGANIINLSLGSPSDSPILHDVIQQVRNQGIPVFAAAGNDDSAELFYPAAYPEVASVTAASGPDKRAPYANFGSFVDLIAPGAGIVYFGNSAYIVNGTSTATAFVSGIVGGTSDAKHVSVSAAAQGILNSPTFRFNPGQ